MKFLIALCLSFGLAAEYKIAFVKQIVFPDLYCLSKDASPRNLIFSSLKRSGPVALFTKYYADFYVVSVESDPMCQLWQEDGTFCSNDPKKFIKFISKEVLSEDSILRKAMVDCNEVDWGQYDIVITLDGAVPARITKKFPHTLWVYYIGEGFKMAGNPVGQTSYIKSFQELLGGYDYFLNQDFGQNPKLADHIIEFPYQLQYYPCYHELLQTDLSEPKSGIFLECHTAQYLQYNRCDRALLSKICPIIGQAGGNKAAMTLQQLIEGVMKAKYFVVCIPPNRQVRNYLRGNCIVEAIAAGALVIARQANLANHDVLTPDTLVNTFEQVCERIQFFEMHPEAYEKEVEAQRNKVNDLCCQRPMNDLFLRCSLKKLRNNLIINK